jgi:hypothetical protein
MKKIKPFVYTVSALMFVAFVWGFIDFAKAAKKGVIKTLYQPQKPVAKDSIKSLEFKDFSRGIIEEPNVKPTNRKVTKSTIIPDSIVINDDKVFEDVFKKELKKSSKKISYKNFSRGSLERVEYPTDIEIIDSTIVVKDSISL